VSNQSENIILGFVLCLKVAYKLLLRVRKVCVSNLCGGIYVKRNVIKHFFH
jgi:hypothetical protein